jgi:hydrogenase-4 component F
VFAEQSVIAMLVVAVTGAALCLLLARPRQVLAAILGVTAAESVFAANLWTAVLSGQGVVTAAEQWFYIDAFSAFHIVVLVLVFLLSSAFAGVYFTSATDHGSFTPPVARRFGALWLGSLAAMLLVLVSNNLGIMWVGMEATTLLSAFLISLYPNRLSLEAMWKYLIICSIGIAFAFMGTLLAAASVQSGGTIGADALFWTHLASAEAQLDPTCSSAMARRPGWRRSIPGCRTRTARLPRQCRRCSPAFC